jgi:hypothetical protein
MSVVRLAASVLATSLLLVFAGCVHPNAQQKPATMTAPGIIILDPDKVQTKDEIAKALAQVAKDYRTHADSGQFAQAKIDRNRFVFTIMGQIEASYGDFEHSFRSRRAAVETITDAALLGVSAAATVVGEAGIKDMLSAASVAGNGTRLSAEKNFFNDEGTIALLTQMRASRSTIEAQIIKRCGDEVTSYSLEEAWKDLNRYVNAGSVESAMIQLAANAGSQNVAAQQKLEDAIASVTVAASQQNVVDSRKVMTIAAALMDAIQGKNGSTPDPAEAQKAADAITVILKSVSAAPPDGTKPAQLPDLLQAKLDAAPGDAVLKGKLFTALSTAPAQFGGTGR